MNIRGFGTTIDVGPGSLRRTAIQNPAARLSLTLIFLLALPPLWLSLVTAPALHVDVGMEQFTFLSGVNAIEHSSGEDYRWTTERTQFTLPNLSSRYQLLRMHAPTAGVPAAYPRQRCNSMSQEPPGAASR